MLDFRNVNFLWASILVETLKRLGLKTAIACPGSRSTPLTVAFAQNPQIEAIPVLDERSAAFFALGIAKSTGLPVALICTSGTAGANFYPAAIEARESRVPLLILTADRPPELRHCHAGQAIDQIKLYGNYPNWQAELALPSLEMEMLAYLRQTVIHAWECTLFPTPGVVHLNVPFRDPLAPIAQAEAEALQSELSEDDFFAGITLQSAQAGFVHGPSQAQDPPKPPLKRGASKPPLLQGGVWGGSWLQQMQTTPPPFMVGMDRGIIIAGVAQPRRAKEYVQAIAHLSEALKFPVLAEGLSPVRNYLQLNDNIISTYDIILRNEELAEKLAPETVIQIGDFPTSKQLRAWLTGKKPQTWVIDPSHHNLDPIHGKTIHLRTSIENLSAMMESCSRVSSAYLKAWRDAERKVRESLDKTMSKIEHLFEGKAAWLLSQIFPTGTPIFIANSMPVRDVEYFWKPNNLEIQPFFNRGANGIDGTLSTALGIAHRHQPCVMLTGDLALLHDTNGFLLSHKLVGHLTIVLINNRGGGIFEMLPISQFDPPFEEFFATPQEIDFAQLCATYNVEYELIAGWEQLQQRLNPLPEKGMRVLELRTDRKADAKWRKENLEKLAMGLGNRVS
ncbi:MAG: 2-succinyl-5-enolpyruvyl-6-hydroxy-3-cyclohexene-1-carboxylic-acid synthase [Hormoscilla sp.]